MLAFRYFFAALLGPNSFWLLAGMILIGAVTYLGALWLTRPQRVVELLDEASSDLQKMKNKTRKKIAGIFARLGLVPTILK
jgi:carbon starvation protein CstA